MDHKLASDYPLERLAGWLAGPLEMFVRCLHSVNLHLYLLLLLIPRGDADSLLGNRILEVIEEQEV